MVAHVQATSIVSKYDNVGLGQIKVVGVLRNPLHRQHLILKAEGVRLRGSLVNCSLREYKEAEKRQTVLGSNHRDIVRAGKNPPGILSKKTLCVARHRPTAVEPIHSRSPHRLIRLLI